MAIDKGVPVPTLSDSPHGPAQITALAEWVDDNGVIEELTTAQRDMLPAAVRWPGRTVWERLTSGARRLVAWDQSLQQWRDAYLADPAANIAGLRTLGTGDQQAADGPHGHTPAAVGAVAGADVVQAYNGASQTITTGSYTTVAPSLQVTVRPAGRLLVCVEALLECPDGIAAYVGVAVTPATGAAVAASDGAAAFSKSVSVKSSSWVLIGGLAAGAATVAAAARRTPTTASVPVSAVRIIAIPL